MNAQNNFQSRQVVMKFLAAVAVVAMVLIVLSGVVFNLDKRITVLSAAEIANIRKSFTSLPESAYIQAHTVNSLLPVEVAPARSFQALPEYGYIQAHSVANTQSGLSLLPVGMRTLTEFSYINAHNQSDAMDLAATLALPLPQGLKALAEFGYIQAHNRSGSETFVGGLPGQMKTLPEFGYIQMHE